MKKPFALTVLLLIAPTLQAQTPQYALAVSSQATRASASFLAPDSVLTGNVYVFSSQANALNPNPAGISHTCYWLDRPATGTPDHCEYVTPYDLKGTFGCASGAGNCGGAWNTATLPDGRHTLTQVVTLTTGSTEVDTTSFRTYNGSLLSLSAAYDDGSPVAGTLALQLLSSNNVSATIATEPLVTGAASYKLVLQLDTLYSVLLVKTDGTVLASFPFALPKILKVDPAALRSAALSLIFRRSDLTLKQATPQVIFDF
jgi:hypothetical protein